MRIEIGPSGARRCVSSFALTLLALAVHVTAQARFAELPGRMLPNAGLSDVPHEFADIDGDGDQDLVAGDRSLRFYENDGHGVFTDATATWLQATIPYSSFGYDLGDVDGDGDLDLVLVGDAAAAPHTGGLLLRNHGDGTFAQSTAVALPLPAAGIFSGHLEDLDGDGDLDLFASGYNATPDQVLDNDGTGTFTNLATQGLGSTGFHCLALADIDLDGDRDLIRGTRPTQLLRNDGNGAFTDISATHMPGLWRFTAKLIAADFDGDQDPDLVLGVSRGHDVYLENDGAGHFTNVTVAHMPYEPVSFATAAGDVDGDGDLDLVLGGIDTAARLYLNDGAGHFADVTATHLHGYRVRSTLALGDVDGDGDLDLYSGNRHWVNFSATRANLFLNDGSGVFVEVSRRRLSPTSLDRGPCAPGDFDGDGSLDLLVADDPLELHRNDGGGVFHRDFIYPLPAGSMLTALVAGDVDGDHDLDLVLGFGYHSPQQTRLLLNDGAGNMTDVTATRMPVDDDWTGDLTSGDFDRDGDLDVILWTGPVTGTCLYYENDGNGTFTDATATHLPPQSVSQGDNTAVDVDGDQDLDLVFPYGLAGPKLYRNNGAGVFTDVTATHMPGNPTGVVAIGDLDGDGAPDLVLRTPQGLYWLANDGSGSFANTTPTLLPSPLAPNYQVGLGDVDGDGDLDLAVDAAIAPSAQLLTNDGTGNFTDATAAWFAPHTTLRQPVFADLDRDGDEDLIPGERPRILFNLRSQLDAPLPLRLGHPFTLEVHSRPLAPGPGDLAVVFFALAHVDVPLPGLGTLIVPPWQAAMLPLLPVPQPSGLGVTTLPIPNVPTLAGLEFHTQALLWQAPTRLLLTNAVHVTALR